MEQLSEKRGEMITCYDESGVAYQVSADGSEAKHIVDLLTAESQGRLVVLPCKVGDTVYMPDPEKIIIPVRVQGIAITASGQTILHFGGYPVEYAWGNEVGKTIHLTHAEAEAALETRKGGGGRQSSGRKAPDCR